jgi:predicted TIM-barrel fold metal-dependent hydrolase
MVGKRFNDPDKLKFADNMKNVRLGGYIPEEHVKDMHIDGIEGEILYPTEGLFLYLVPDSALLSAVCRTYNDWIAEFCRPFPRRLKGIAMINIDDVQEGVQELQRAAKLGLAGGLITCYPPESRPYYGPEYDPLWAAAQALDMPLSLSLHVSTNRPSASAPRVDLEAITPSVLANIDHWVRMSLGDMIFGGVFERYPKLRVGSVEHEVSWAVHFIDRLDYTYTQRPATGGRRKFKGEMLPSDFFHRNVFLSFQDDALGVKMRDILGVDNLMWGSDYPHPECMFPMSRQVLEKILTDCTEEEKAKIAGGNAARLYHFD